MTLLILFITFLLRLPSFFEPYWYGDEGIYLAVGQVIQRGAVLYRDIWDNKTPLLYLIYGLAPTLLWAKISAAACVLGTVYFVKKITKSNLAALLTGIFLSIPLFEGSIANAELYFTLPIVATVYILLRNKPNYLLIGSLFSISFLIKFPAVFDFIGLFLALFIINRKIRPFLVMAIPIILSFSFFIFYFLINNAFGDFLTASFFQNASYVAVDSGPFSKFSNPLFTRGILLLLSSTILSVLFWKRRLSKEFLFFGLWFGFSLYGALLSNRPYLHYLLQIIPPAIILVHYLIKNIKKYYLVFIPLYLVFRLLQINFSEAFRLPTWHYYENFYGYVSGLKTWKDYANWFDARTVTNYQIASYLSGDNLFVWGDNAFIYVLSGIAPTTKFIQAHHLTTIDPSNLDKITDQIRTKKPKFIVVVRPVRFPFPKLETIIDNNYRLKRIIGENYIYQILGNISNKTAY
ncbi:hypothetical protein A2872_01375 [Candidatus Gottesmanbacteria bacterium RIFCSPHIGHO2_01_FULL_42_12]|uniref:Glycosyltransferase RgtA/B/C/D-like domain-containing protein n=1 Tax=Candidatus Gottesmanbacteria bacterium RIFCSPHIGHO2_01_FULL_42_12 TaxID=1798377 RepID=A0A1F5Z455_9BACT|nr:MAG: hypothetical protein A2872_01375 [Candidatus Gottesmanbacteria bacterium RIFCSPHIGHO2_01_FULL_42_12]